MIRVNTKLKACPQKKTTIFEVESPKGKSYQDYMNVGKEILKTHGGNEWPSINKQLETRYSGISKKKHQQSSRKKPVNTPNQVIEQQEGDKAAPSTAKWHILDKVIVPLTMQQKEGLDRIAKQLMRERSKNALYKERKDRERITANTLMRALADILLEEGIFNEVPAVYSEEETKSWLKQILFKQKI